MIQFVAIQFAISLAKHDAPAVKNFENYGIPVDEMSRFHRYNFWTKLFFCSAAALVMQPNLLSIFFGGVVSALWVYLIFDIALNISRKNKKWDYLGLNDADGRFWNGLFKKHSGKMKAVVLLLFIIITNTLWHLLKK